MSLKLSFCMRAIKTLDAQDLDALTVGIETYVKAGMKTEQAEAAAVNDLLAALATERADMVALLRAQHPEQFTDDRPALPPSAPATTAEAPAAAPAAAKPPKGKNKAAREAEEAMDRISAYYAPGNIVRGYSGFDEVLSFKRDDGTGWRVLVQEVRDVGGQWVRQGKPQNARWHATMPDKRELATGPHRKLFPLAGERVPYSEPRADGKPFPNAPARGAVPAGTDSDVKPAAPAPTKEAAKPEVSKNTIFTEDAAARARAVLRSKIGTLRSLLDPEEFQAGATLAGYHIERGARTFAAYAKAMVEDIGEAVRPYLKSWYAAIYYDPRAAALQADMTPPAQLDAAAAAAEEQDHVRDADTGVEPDRGDAGNVEREVGEALSGRGLGEGPQTSGKRTGSARRGRADDAGVPTGGASPLRELGDQPVRRGAGAAEPSLFDAGTVDGERSDDPGIAGVQPDPGAAGPAARPAAAWASAIEKRAAQRAAESVAQAPGIENIRATLPYLLPAQQDDVAKAETRFSKPDGYGMLFTNGTGTGKTFSGLGIIKRFVRAGKRNVLVVVPDNKIMSDWIESGSALGLDIKALADTKDAGRGVTITTYANLGENDALATRSWDLVVPDEVHMLMQSADGKQTKALDALRAITLHPRGIHDRFAMLNRDDVNEAASLAKAIDAASKQKNIHDMAEDRARFDAAMKRDQAKLDALTKKLRQAKEAVTEDVRARQGEKRTRVAGLSATPFAYEKTVDWADGYLFDYAPGGAEEQSSPGYNDGDARDKFFVQHFGYRMRYNKLTEPDSKVDRGLLQRQFNGWLKKQGVLSGRMLDVQADYDRRFILAESAVGNEIDRAIEWIREQAKASRIAKKDVVGAVDGWAYVEAELDEQLFGRTGHLVRRYLLEAIKAKEVVAHVREHMAIGRKVVVFHDFKKGGSHNPFAFAPVTPASKPGPDMGAEAYQKYLGAVEARNEAAAEFRSEFPNLAGDRLLAELVSPIARFKREFPGVLLINGDEKPADLLARYKRFNDDAVGPQVALVQSAKNKGWSGHDTTGKHQRVLFNLGLPTQPTMSIQQEGRIYRTGQVSNAIFRYLNTGTNWERWAFAQTIAERASAAENLATGELARALKDAFIAGFEQSGDFPAGHEGEGTGGKERDRMANDAISEYDRAKAFYWGTAKKTAKTKAQEGTDYFATPEPVGFKMVQMLDLRGGEDALEPSAGHGAIARWFPETANRTAVEPSNTLGSRLAMVFDGKITRGDFEALHVVNKFDGIAMNPPFGTAGRTAIDHLAKAAQQHLREGGRVVALIPTGPAADKKFDKWFYEEEQRPRKPVATHPTLGPIYVGDTITTRASWMPSGVVTPPSKDIGYPLMARPDGSNSSSGVTIESVTSIKPTGKRTETYRPAEGLHLVADIKLPAVTFERAGTQVMTRIVVIEKTKAGWKAPAQVNRDYTGVDDINALFDRMEDLELPPRAGAPTAEEVEARAPAAAPAPAPKTAAKAEKAAAAQQGEALAAATGAVLVEHTTGKGKLLKGVIRKDLTRAQAETVDAYTFPKNGGFFIRAEHLKKLAEKYPDAQLDLSEEPIPAGEALEGDADPRDVEAVADLQGKLNRVKTKPVTLTALPPMTRPPAGAPRAEAERFAATELVSKVFDKRAVFFSADGGAVNGAALASQPKVLFVNEAARRPVLAVLGHELLHQMRRDNPALYDRLADRLDELVRNPGEHFMEFVERYTSAGVAIPDVQKIREELVADIVGDNFTDPAFWRGLQEGRPGLFQRVLGAVRDFLTGVLEHLRNERPFGTDKYLSDVVAARDAVVQAMQEYAAGKAVQASDDAYTGPTMAEIEALASTPTVAVMREAIEAVGEREFERLAKANIDTHSRGGKFKVLESMLIEATARGIVAMERRKQGDVSLSVGGPAARPAAWRDATNRVQFAPGQWLYSALGRLASPLLVRAGMKAASPELRRMLREMKLEVQKAQETAAKVAAEGATMTSDEREMVSDIVEQELAAGVTPPAHAVRLAALMNQTMGAQTKELVQLGMLSDESATRWDGKYLPRFYESKLRKKLEDAWGDAVRRLLGRTSAMKGIKGSHLKGRGMWETISTADLPNYLATGWEVRDPGHKAGDPEVQVWRDYTRDEREKMGEIRDSIFRFVMGYMQTQRDLALGRMFSAMAANREFSSRTEKPGWVRVPSTVVEDTGVRRYGLMAGRYVPREVMSHLSQIEESSSAAWTMYRTAMGLWKEAKTALNPVAHANNIVSNLTMAHFAGVSYHRADLYVAAIKDFIWKSPAIKEAKDAGLFLGSISDAELMDTLPQELKDLVAKTDPAEMKGAKFVYNAMTFFLRKPMGAAYRAEDTFFRYLIYKDARRRGLDPGDAVDYSQRYIFTYDDLPKGARMVRDFGIPFFGYTYKATPVLLYTALVYPWLFAAPAAVMWAANAAAYAIAIGDEDDDWYERLQKYINDPAYRQKAREKEKLERELLPPWMKGETALGTPKTIRMGMDEVTKLPLFLDVSRFVPGGDMFDVSPNAGGIPLPQPITPSHPLFTAAVAMIGNKDLFTGKEVVDQNDTNAEAAGKRADWLWKQVSPSIAAGNAHWERGMNALAQATGSEVQWLPGAPEAVAKTYTGIGKDRLPVQPGLAAAQTFGIKLRPIDLDLSAQISDSQRKVLMRGIDIEIRRLKFLNEAGAVPDKVFEDEREKALEKKERIREGLTVDGDPK